MGVSQDPWDCWYLFWFWIAVRKLTVWPVSVAWDSTERPSKKTSTWAASFNTWQRTTSTNCDLLLHQHQPRPPVTIQWTLALAICITMHLWVFKFKSVVVFGHLQPSVPALAAQAPIAPVTAPSAISAFRLKIIWPILCLTASMISVEIDVIGQQLINPFPSNLLLSNELEVFNENCHLSKVVAGSSDDFCVKKTQKQTKLWSSPF